MNIGKPLRISEIPDETPKTKTVPVEPVEEPIPLPDTWPIRVPVEEPAKVR